VPDGKRNDHRDIFQSIGRPKALDESKTALARRMHASGESAIGTALGVSPATVYSVFADDAESGVYA